MTLQEPSSEGPHPEVTVNANMLQAVELTKARTDDLYREAINPRRRPWPRRGRHVADHRQT